MQRVIVFGSSGQLAQCLKQVVAEQHIKDVSFFPGTTVSEADALESIFAEQQPAYCINCAAYTAVDKAEDETEEARRVNKDGAANLATACKKHNTVLIHVSTDFVFEGNSPHPLSEADQTNPINVYGLTKLEGELAIAEALPAHYIIRTSWLYSEYGNNFVKTMLRLGREKEELKIIADQVGTPTYAIDLAKSIFAMIAGDKGQYGIYHFSNEGVTSWYDFAKAVFDISHTSIRMYPVRTAEYVTKATRPAYSVMDKAKIKQNFSIEIPYWRDSLELCIKKLAVQQA
ncbi:dTDP-4-dehydrorhamnose reductase [Mucilaginibacter sp. Bleaf8]|uniref:dTDP-4-dehydrorhamnose reductase n=1 Tax=Mucilaginibacter sp. Bleaf8 TaxID=2834430 RepID=UPI001BD057B2|nr:dTDP-4-dehydrorhamnose reductase [Mucilaginibacter sp. Bleaf8]MBS7567026.1 dTDP-4-dehydrorhamnose reductase [Mucilaginibacter sp. Bleaf8]